MCEDQTGRVWLGTGEHGLFYWADEKMVPVPDDFLKSRNIFSLAAEADGRIWIGTELGLRCCDANGQPQPAPAVSSEIDALLIDHHGVLWVGTSGSGLARYHNGKLTFFRKADGLGSDYVTSIFEDAEGSLWIGTRDGLNQLSDLKFPILSTHEGILPGSSHWVSASRNEGIWISTPVGISYFNGETAKNFSGAALLPNQWVNATFESRTGDVYVIDGGKGIAVLSGDRISALYPGVAWPTSFAEDAKSILVAVAGSLYRIENGQTRP